MDGSRQAALSPEIPWEIASRLLWIPDRSRSMGVRVMAGRGAGKSRLLGRIIAWEDFLRGVPLVVLDPHGPTIDNFVDKLLYLPAAVQRRLAKRILYVNMNGMDGHVPTFPLYFRFGDESLYRVSQRYLDILRRIDPFLVTASVEGWNALWRIGTYTGMALAALDRQITDADEFLAQPTNFLGTLGAAAKAQPELAPVLSFFGQEFSQWDARTRASRTEAFLTKTALFRLDPTMRAMFGASTMSINWQRVVDERQAVLLDFRDEHDVERMRFKLLWVYSTFLEFVRRRGAGRHTPISLIVDELTYLLSMQTHHGSILEADLDELINRLSRNFSLWLTLAHQELSQVSEPIRKALMTMGTQIIGSTSDPESARFLASRFSRFDPSWVRKREPMYTSYMGNTHVIDYRTVEYTRDEQAELRSFRFLDLPRYHFLVAVAANEGTAGGHLQRMTIERFDQGMFVNEELVTEARAILMRRNGRPMAELLDNKAAHPPQLPSPRSRVQRVVRS
jgi:hypothetical protein